MREWIVTNGLGSYASLTHSNANTRKFHGLLVASLDPPTNRWVFAANVYDKIQIENRVYDLKNYKSVFDFDVFPSFFYEIEDVQLKKTYFMEQRKNTTIIKYEIKTDKPISLIHTPVINSRHFYDVTKNRYLSFNQDVFEHGVRVKPGNIDKTLKIMLKNSIYAPAQCWEVFYYDRDRERNDSWVDNNLQIGEFCKTVKNSSEYYLTFTLED